MSDIVLCTLNSTYQHASFGLRYLMANLGDLKSRAQIKEFTINRNTRELAEEILILEPKIVGFGVYIWNTDETYELVQLIRKLRPSVRIVLGGPEVSYESETQAICKVADFVVQGEADFLFRELCTNILSGNIQTQKYIRCPLPDITAIALPYDFYGDEDVRNRIVYVEASRGCPYKCEYCLSSLDKNVRNFPLEPFLAEMRKLLDKGLRQFKFIDRTFNLSPKVSGEILKFFLKNIDLGLFLHFEMVPDRLPSELRELIQQFPPGSLQFEIGIQTFNPEVAKNVSRKNDLAKVEENFRFLRENTRVHTHADLIVGLPGETLQSFGEGFDKLYSYCPDEIQVGLLKRLKGTPIIRHDQEHGMLYQDHAPFQILQTKSMTFTEVQLMVRFAKFWDLYANSGHFTRTLPLLLCKSSGSAFARFMEFVEYLSRRFPATQSGISLLGLTESMYDYLISRHLPEITVRDALRADYGRNGRRTLPKFLQDENVVLVDTPKETLNANFIVPSRQRNHLRI